jgi:nucleoside-diphosphate-sugar epimerase
MIVSILGCGWLGKALAKSLIQKDFVVKGSATTTEKVALLEAEGIQGYQIKLDGGEHVAKGSDFWTCDALIVASNVKLQGNEGYMEGIKAVGRITESKKIQRVIIISSTSVYGEPNTAVDESSMPQPITASATSLIEIENLFEAISTTQTTTMRCGGLVGPGRMPGSFLAGKQKVENGLAPVNLIHQADCIGIIERLLQTGHPPKCINAVAADHPYRYEFYIAAAKAQDLPLPSFVLNQENWKIVNSKVSAQLGYQYQINDWLLWLKSGINPAFLGLL